MAPARFGAFRQRSRGERRAHSTRTPPGHAWLHAPGRRDPRHARPRRTFARSTASRGARPSATAQICRREAPMTWADFYLICFVVGFAFSVLAFLSGGATWRLHVPHLPHGHGPFGHI